MESVGFRIRTGGTQAQAQVWRTACDFYPHYYHYQPIRSGKLTHRHGTSTISTILFACIYQESVFRCSMAICFFTWKSLSYQPAFPSDFCPSKGQWLVPSVLHPCSSTTNPVHLQDWGTARPPQSLTARKATEKWWLEVDPLLLGCHLFRISQVLC